MRKLYKKVKRLLMLMVLPQLLMFLGCKPKIKYGNNAEVGKYYPINGIKMYVEEYGSGKPLLMIHGNGGDMSAFSENVPHFAKKYRVILVDSRSQGKTADNADSLSFEQMADDFAVLLDTLKVPKAYIIGWSDGGINALLLAIRHPNKVIKLASTGANITPDASAFAGDGWKQSEKYYLQNRNRVWKTPKAKNAWKMFLLDWSQPNIKPEQLQQIKCPALIIGGEHDVIADAHTRMIQKNIPGAELWIVPNSGHGTLIEHAKEFNKKVEEFFEK